MAASGFSDEECERRAARMQQHLPTGFRVTVRAQPSGLATLDPPDYADRVVAGTIRDIAGFDPTETVAVVLGVALDLGLREARLRARVPVVGPGEAALFLASVVGLPLSVIAVDRMTAALAETWVRSLPARPPVVSIRSMDTPLDVVVRDAAAARVALTRECEAAARQGAGAVYLGAMTLSLLEGAADLPRRLGLRVFDPMPIALATAVACAGTAS
jgi:Asp/Glu/hydantoin racemase